MLNTGSYMEGSAYLQRMNTFLDACLGQDLTEYTQANNNLATLDTVENVR
jgi:hypothetical protein